MVGTAATVTSAAASACRFSPSNARAFVTSRARRIFVPSASVALSTSASPESAEAIATSNTSAFVRGVSYLISSTLPSLSGMPLQKSLAICISANARAKYSSAIFATSVSPELLHRLDRLCRRRARPREVAEHALDGRVARLDGPLVRLVVLNERRARGPLVGEQPTEQPRAPLAPVATDEPPVAWRKRPSAPTYSACAPSVELISVGSMTSGSTASRSVSFVLQAASTPTNGRVATARVPTPRRSRPIAILLIMGRLLSLGV